MKRVLKWISLVLGGLLVIVILAFVAISVVSARRLNRTYEVTANFSLNVSPDPESIAEGKRLYTIMCQSCHGEDLAGQIANDFMMGQIHVANLTTGAGGIGSSRSDEEMARAVVISNRMAHERVVCIPLSLIYWRELEVNPKVWTEVLVGL